MSWKQSYRTYWSDQDGAVAATYALVLVPLIAIAGLGFDYARVMGMDTELQNGADQAALAAATQLDRTAGSMERAINAATGNLVTNSTILSNDGSGGTIAITDTSTQIVFYANKVDAESGQNSFTDTSRFAEARFVEVTVDTRDARYAFTPVVGAVVGSLNGAAVAGMGSALCRIPPLMICNPDEPGSGDADAGFDAAARKGQGLIAKPGGGSGGWFPGEYGFLDIGPNGATGIRQALGWNDPPGNCLSVDGSDILEATEVDGAPGNVASGPQALNTRFDIYSTQGCVGSGTCSPAQNVRKDVVRAATPAATTGNSCSFHNSGWVEPTNAYRPLDATLPYSGTIDSMGHPRDVCHAIEDNPSSPRPGNCHSTNFGNGVWDRDAYFRTHYVRTTATAFGAVGTSWSNTDWQRELAGEAAAGINNITRYEVYKWEETNRGTLVDGVPILGDTPVGASGSTLTTRNQPVCGPAYGSNPISRDRRLMSVAIVNCKAHDEQIRNKKDIPIRQFIDIFLVQPSMDRGPGNRFGKKDEIYVEIVALSEIRNDGANVGTVFRRDLPYLVR